MSSGPVLLVPACERGKGGGHLSRCLFVFRALLAKGRDVCLWIPESLKNDLSSRFAEFFEPLNRELRNINGGGKGRLLSFEEELLSRDWDFIVLDRFRTSKKEYAFWSAIGPLVGIDEGGPCRKYFDFLVDLLPALSKVEPNLTAPALLPLPRRRRSLSAQNTAGRAFADRGSLRDEVPLRILISFGAEDSAGLGFSAAAFLAGAAPGQSPFCPPQITLIAPKLPGDNSREAEGRLSGVKLIPKLPGLRDLLWEYDLFITHFGLGAFEAVYSRVPVLLISPTAYHEKLSRAAGFFSLGRGRAGVRRLGKLNIGREFLESLGRRGGKIASRYGLADDQKEDIGSFINGLSLRSFSACPFCEEKPGFHASALHTNPPLPSGRAGRRLPVLARFPEESFRRCGHCGGIYLNRLSPPPVVYERDYFFDFYKKQYGKTYLEDFPNLIETGRKRLVHIRNLLSPRITKPSLLDIGCAYGPFLAAAAECGFSPAGIEPAEDAVRYIKEELGFPVWKGFFPPFPDEAAAGQSLAGKPVLDDSFDAVSLWYTIEHFEEPGRILGEIRRILKEGGVLAFSTPSFSGISGRKSLGAFLKNSPPDHWTLWSPRICKKLLKRYGFRLRKIVVTGHHPERFPFFGRFLSSSKRSLLYRLLFFISRVFRLGDTFEVYGKKSASL